jgi:hypothetical protein
MDSGATDRVCHNLHFFSAYKKIKPISVKLPDSSYITCDISGTVFFSKSLFLIPAFNFNLISITKLTSTIFCQLLIDRTSCVIQEKQSLKMIGFAKRNNGLYILDDASPILKHDSTICSFSSVNNNLWRLRLGHISVNKHSAMHNQYACIDSPKHDFPCDICHMTRMNRLPFPNSTMKSESVFDLLHIDIWGPMPQPSIHGDKYFI